MLSPLKGSLKSFRLALSNWGLSWGGVIDNRQGEWWLIAQIILVIAHLLPAYPPFAVLGLLWPTGLTVLGTCLLFIGIVLVGMAFLCLGVNLSPLPIPKTGANLVTRGSYSSCRHPLYRGLIISSIGVMIALGSILHLLILVSLTMLLISKAKKEEQQLRKKHSKYINYMKNTPAIMRGIPYLDWRA